MGFLPLFNNKINLIGSVCFVLSFYSGVAFSWSFGYGYIDQVRFNIEPSNEFTKKVTTTSMGFVCYDYRTGKQSSCYLTYTYAGLLQGMAEECVISSTGTIVPHTCANGGHTHNDPERPVVFDNGAILYPGDSDPSKHDVSGNTLGNGDFKYVVHKQSQAAGLYHWQMDIDPGYGYYFPPPSYTGGNYRIYGITDTNVKGLVQLRDSSLYNKVRTPETAHQNYVTYASAEITRNAVPLIAKTYRELSGLTLSINDISLPKGGVFTYIAPFDWQFSHIEHRDGMDADINRERDANNARVPCVDHKELIHTVNQYLYPNQRGPSIPKPSAILCESNGNIHIDFTTLLALPDRV
jgi:hypothetical protein